MKVNAALPRASEKTGVVAADSVLCSPGFAAIMVLDMLRFLTATIVLTGAARPNVTCYQATSANATTQSGRAIRAMAVRPRSLPQSVAYNNVLPPSHDGKVAL